MKGKRFSVRELCSAADKEHKGKLLASKIAFMCLLLARKCTRPRS
jgi:hypothetical protein